MAITLRGSVLLASDAAVSDIYGSAVALSADGTVMAVGAPWRAAGDGGVYVYDLSGSTWVQRGSVLPTPNTGSGESFGMGVALSDDGAVLAVGAPGLYEAVPEKNGGVHLFDWSGSAWVHRGVVTNDATVRSFGFSVALSGDGAVLAVGSPDDDFFGTNAGGVWLFDWSGSAWSMRGGMLYTTETLARDQLGQSVALSSSGTVLAVGGSWFDVASAGDNRGAVWLFDWSSSAWVQRASRVSASDAGNDDHFGSSVALSSDGAIMAVGAIDWDAITPPPYSQGIVYLFDWSGSAWAEREVVALTAPVAYDNFGSAVALSSTGAVLAAGASGLDATYSDQGGVFTYDITSGEFATALTSLTVTLSSGLAQSAPTELTVVSRAYAPTSLVVSSPSGAATAPTALSMVASGTASAASLLAVIDASHATHWSATCLIDGVDVSARLTGSASVTADEGAARIASLTLLPVSGTINPLDYVGKPIVLDYVLLIGGVAVPRRLFTGRIDTPEYNPSSGMLQLTCVDDLQNRVAVLPRAVIEGLVGGRYSTAVHGELDDNWDYAEALLSTVAASLDAGASGGMRVTPWELSTTWATFGESDLLYERATLTLPQRSTLVNQVDIEFDYRYPRLRQRYTTTGWSGTMVDMAPNGYQYPTQQDVLGAAGGTGWTVTLGVFYPAPAAIPHSSGGFIYPAADAIDMAILHLTQRHSQTVTETFTLQVNADESIALNGVLPHALRGALASTFDGSAWESALDVAPLMPSGGEQDYAPDATRADADYAIDTLLAQALVKILSSHRGARVGNAILCNPDLDVDKKVAIATAEVTAAGKVASVIHLLDFKSGSATSEFELAIFGAGGAGLITPTTLAPPAPPAAAAETQDWPSAIPTLYVNTYGVTPYNDNLMGLLLNPPETILVEDVPGVGSQSFPNVFYTAGSYPVTGFRARMPGVDDADRNPLDKPVSASYSIIVPDDAMTFTVP